MEIQDCYCVVPKLEDHLETELKQHNDSLICLFHYASKLSEFHLKEDIRSVEDKIRSLRNSCKTLVCDPASMKWKLQKFTATQELLSSSK